MTTKPPTSAFSLADLLDRPTLRRMAGSRSFERGEHYFEDGRVGLLTERERTVYAKVRGSRTYRAEFRHAAGELAYSCSCPVGRDGSFCKHLVAVALAWLVRKESGAVDHLGPADAPVTMEDVRDYLGGQAKETLIDMLLDQVIEDERLRRRLSIQVAKAGSRGSGVAACRRAIDEAVDCDDFIDYRGAYDYASGIEEALEPIEELLDEGDASEVIDLAEYALGAVEEAAEQVDDSDGYMGGILERLQEIHLRACERARPDPEELARRLFAWELRSNWGTFYGAADTYSDILGEKGLAVYRQLAETEWAKVPALASGESDSERYPKRFRITNIMHTLARKTGDVEDEVAVLKRDLSWAYHYLRVAETYERAGKHDLALEWAERGVETFPERTDARLRTFLADEYHRRGRHDDAMTLVWAEFEETKKLEAFENLKSHADRAGNWAAWREKALNSLRQSIAEAKRTGRRSAWAAYAQPDHSELVRIFLSEEDYEAAWREAVEGGCSNGLWMQLAAERGKDHPEDALPVYRRQVESALQSANNDSYRKATEHLKKIRNLMKRLDRSSDFAAYLSGVRKTHKRKRNFMKMLDGVRWS